MAFLHDPQLAALAASTTPALAYRDYLKDIRASGEHVVPLLNDLLDLARIEAGKLDQSLASLSLNAVVQSCVTLMQPQANRERIIIGTSLPPTLPPLTADARALPQITFNLLSSSIKFTHAGGQVIVSTAQSEQGEIVLRVRDTGIAKELGVALEPFRKLATTARWGSDGTGLGLPLTKGLPRRTARASRFPAKSTMVHWSRWRSTPRMRRPNSAFFGEVAGRSSTRTCANA